MAMRTNDEPVETEEQFSLPLDLAEWVDSCKLMDWVEEIVEQFDWKDREVADYLRRNPAYRPKTMLCLLAYAYATQVFGAEEIVRRCYSDTIFRLLCENHPPTVAELSRFRRENRGLLKGMLVPLFVRALKAKFNLGDVWIPPGLKGYLLKNAVERLDIARHMDNFGD
jgi:transposase